MFDWLRRIFGRSSSRAGTGPRQSGSADGLESRLAEFVSSADGAPGGAEPRRAQQQSEKIGSREMIAAARETVELVQGRFQAYVRDRVLKRFGDDFRLETPNTAQTRDLDARFGDPKTGNEYRYMRVAFKDRFAIVVRAQAMILSRDIQVKSLFLDVRSGDALAQEVDLSRWEALADVEWEKVFEAVFLEFLDWHQAASKQP